MATCHRNVMVCLGTQSQVVEINNTRAVRRQTTAFIISHMNQYLVPQVTGDGAPSVRLCATIKVSGVVVYLWPGREVSVLPTEGRLAQTGKRSIASHVTQLH